MIVGQWEKTETFGLSGLMGFFYTTDFDDRQEQPAVTVHTNIVGTDMGYGNPAYSTPPTLWCVGGVSRSRYYMHRTTVDTTETFALDVAALVAGVRARLHALRLPGPYRGTQFPRGNDAGLCA
ncbi:hypothetical protein [Pseudomonas aeruginosa]|uniref:hypothetical protein n=1 Tax=Pseudomonas aeruginosa TaxID=287 RepID=UPI001D01C2AB|nr:hypothetical protein [Pseudomonas aeruginosa]